VRRVFRTAGFRYTHSRKTGVLWRGDLRQCIRFAKRVRRFEEKTLWTTLTSRWFTHKYNPYNQAKAPRSMVWWRPVTAWLLKEQLVAHMKEQEDALQNSCVLLHTKKKWSWVTSTWVVWTESVLLIWWEIKFVCV